MKSCLGQGRAWDWWVLHLHPLVPPHASGSKSQNCLWNSIIDGLTGNVKEKPRPTIVHDPRPPEQILADELPQLDSPEALVKTSFRFAPQLVLSYSLWSYFHPVGCVVSVASGSPHAFPLSELALRSECWDACALDFWLGFLNVVKITSVVKLLLAFNWYWHLNAEAKDLLKLAI